MALDTVTLNPGALGNEIGVDKIAGVDYEVVKSAFGAAGSITLVSAADPLPVADADANAALSSIAAEDFATQTTLAAVLAKITSDPATQTTLAAILSKIIAAPATEAKQDAIAALLTTIAAISQPLTDTELRATPVPVSFSSDIQIGAVELKNSTTDDRGAVINIAPTTEFGVVTRNIPSGTQPVSGTFFQATQPVSAAALPLPSGAATAANQQTNALTDAELRATPVPISGTVTVNEPVSIDDNGGAITVDATDLDIRNLVFATDKVDASGSTGVGVTGTFFQATQPVSAAALPLPTGAATVANQQTDALTDTQLRATPIPVSGTVTVSEPVSVDDNGGALTVDAVDLDIRNLVFATDKADVSGSTGVGVTGTFFQATQPVSAAALPLPTGAATAANQQTDALTDTELRATPVPISGTVTVNEPVTVDAVDLDIRNLVFATDKADVSGSTAVGVTGTFFQATQPVSATNLDIRDLTFAADKVDASGTVLGAGANNIGDVDVLTLPSIPAGTNNIGDVDVASIAAGANVIGKVGIDQTTPGTTNLVALTAETTKVIGTVNVSAAQTIANVTTVDTITNNVNTVEVVATAIFNGKTTVTTAGTRVVLAASQAVKSVTIKALSTNTGFIYVGNSTVAASNGFQLSAGDTVSLDIANLNTINIDSSVNGEGVTYISIL